MIAKFFNVASRKREADMYAYLPVQVQNEIRDAMEATSVYDIR